MKVNELKEIIQLMVKHKIKTPLIVLGEAGTGKTQTILDVGEELQVPVSILRIGSKNDVSDLLGITTLKTGSMYVPPTWLKVLQGKGILLLDEIDRSGSELKDVIRQLLDSRRFGEFVLPDDVVIIGTANPTEEFEKVLYNRCIIVQLQS